MSSDEFTRIWKNLHEFGRTNKRVFTTKNFILLLESNFEHGAKFVDYIPAKLVSEHNMATLTKNIKLHVSGAHLNFSYPLQKRS